jgi:hypothetical protein
MAGHYNPEVLTCDWVKMGGRSLCSRITGHVEYWAGICIWMITAFIRWDEKAGLRGMRYAPSGSTCSRHKEKETGNAEA